MGSFPHFAYLQKEVESEGDIALNILWKIHPIAILGEEEASYSSS
jgi:hypothetical protein